MSEKHRRKNKAPRERPEVKKRNATYLPFIPHTTRRGVFALTSATHGTFPPMPISANVSLNVIVMEI